MAAYKTRMHVLQQGAQDPFSAAQEVTMDEHVKQAPELGNWST